MRTLALTATLLLGCVTVPEHAGDFARRGTLLIEGNVSFTSTSGTMS